MFCIQQKRSPNCSRVSAASGTRSTGYELQKEGNGVFRVSQGYSANGRIATASFMHEEIERTFRYHYLPGSDLLQILSMPNGIMLTQSYEEKRNLLTGMDYVRENSLVTQRRYTYDALARPETRDTRYPNKRISHNDSFAYNHRRELTGAPLGNSAYTYAYDNIGNRITAEGDVSQSIQWSSEYNDTELDLVYYNYRYYSPTDGRWTRRDPIGIEGGINLHAYILNYIGAYDYLGLLQNTTCNKNNTGRVQKLEYAVYFVKIKDGGKSLRKLTPSYSGEISNSEMEAVAEQMGKVALKSFLEKLKEKGKETIKNIPAIKAAIEKYAKLTLPLSEETAALLVWAGGEMLNHITIEIKGEVCCCTGSKYMYVEKSGRADADAYNVSIIGADSKNITLFIKNIAQNLANAFQEAKIQFKNEVKKCKKK